MSILSANPNAMKNTPTIRDLYPHLNDEQLAEVEETWDRYLELVLRIFERSESEGKLNSIFEKFDSPQGSTYFCGKCDF